jgi:ATP-binding cassette subfamily G (WHITE) protein 2 (SNQ2)
VLSNTREEFREVSGDVFYGNAGAKEAQQFRHQIVMNTEEDLHFPTLKVGETLNFASSSKLSGTRPEHLKKRKAYTSDKTESILNSLSIAHTSETVVGDEYLRGVSGGERKRVSLAEVLTSTAPVQCWDNSTRGLDASNALDFAKVLRKSAHEEQKTIVATLYQAGNGIYDQFDKVTVLVDGKQIYYGQTSEAKGYFEDLGFICTPGANIADFLTSVSVPTERQIAPGFEGRVPETADEFAARFRASTTFHRNASQAVPVTDDTMAQEIRDLEHVRTLEKNRSWSSWLSRRKSPYHISLWRQIIACTKRQYQIIWGDRLTNILNISSAVIMSLVTASLFYNLQPDSSSIFPRPGALFFPILLFGLNAMSEVQASFLGRPIISRHKRLAYTRPAAYAIAKTVMDIPLVVITISLFQIIYYFMVGFQHNAGKFFTQWVLLVAMTLCFLSFFRTIGAWCRHFGMASQIAGACIMGIMVYAGYLIPVPEMHVWFRWIAYINPASYCLQALLASEMGNLDLACISPQYVPFGPSYTDSAFRACTVAGTSPGADTINGESYVEVQYDASSGTIWRNFGIIVAFWVFWAFTAALGFEYNLSVGTGAKVLFDRNSRKKQLAIESDLEKSAGSSSSSMSDTKEDVSAGETIFTFENIDYFVHHEGKEKQLLQHVSGYVKPGQLVALMGSSGAGKTTLMDVLAQRKDSGRIEGSIMVSLPIMVVSASLAYQIRRMPVREQPPNTVVFASITCSVSKLIEQHRSTDGHKAYRSSAPLDTASRTMYMSLLRQFWSHYCSPHDCVKATTFQMLRKCYTCIVSWTSLSLLLYSTRLLAVSWPEPEREPVSMNLHISGPGLGLSIEQRKRLTLATELVAKPSLLFLDEPTSGLDGQSAFEICRFMRKLAASGQTIICTIHQPSAALFEAFDVLLLLAKGGRTTYFGETGRNSRILLDYFARNGAPCPENANPAEHIVDVVQGRQGDGTDWPQQWLASPEYQHTMEELKRINLDQAKDAPAHIYEPEDTADFATPLRHQLILVTKRQLIALWRNPDYIWNKIGLHVTNSLFAGFTFWMIGNGTFDLQFRLMSVFNFVFVAPGCINQNQPLFLRNRDIFESREKKSKTYHWLAFITAQVFSEIPVLIVCATLFFACWYFTSGFPVQASISGQVYLQMILYEFLYTSLGQAIAAYSPNAYFAALANPIIIGAFLINFCGVVVSPHSQKPFILRGANQMGRYHTHRSRHSGVIGW